VDSIPVDHIPISVGYDPLKGVLFVGNSGDNTTSIVSEKTRSVIDTVPISSVVMLYDSGRNVMLDLGNGSIQFVSDDSLPSVSPTPTSTPTPEPTPNPEPFPTTLVIASVIVVAVIAMGLLVYFKKRKH
jgi:YVTN family beta-propeller protein